MGRTVDLDSLPPQIVPVVRSWVAAVEAASRRMGDELRVTAEDAIASLRGRIVMTAPLEATLIKSNLATLVLANKLDRRATLPSKERTEALTALNALIVELRNAKPKER
ncbi:hypothetical protein FOHLNKBM_5339 [Methylobacterium longum]|nr:hypothetical protein FOHLNKBM_5339 [Methylobacterium longum]